MRGTVVQRPFLRRRKPISEINMTPLIDLTFLLLITFVITFPLIQHGIPLKLPSGKALELPATNKRTVSIDVRGNIYLDDRVCSMDTLKDTLLAIGRTRDDTTILVRADEGVSYGKVAQVMRVIHGVGLSRVALVTQVERK